MPKSMIKSQKLETDIPPVDPTTDEGYVKTFSELTQKTFKKFELKDPDNYPKGWK